MSDKIQYKSTGAIHKDEGKEYGILINDDTKFNRHKDVEDIEHTFKSKKEEIQFEIREIEESIKLINQKASIPTEQSIRKIGQLEAKKSVLKAEYEKLLKEELEKIEVYQSQIIDAKEPVKVDTQKSIPNFISEATYICQFCFKSFEHNPSKCSKCGLILCEEHAHNHSCIKYYRIEEQHRHEIVGTYPPRKTLFDKIKIPFENLIHKIGFIH